MHGLPHQFPIVQEVQQNPWYGESLENWYSYVSHSLGAFLPLDSLSIVYFITWVMHVFSHQFPMTWEKTAKPIEWGKPGKNGSQEYPTNPSYGENPGNWYSYFSHSMGAFFPLDSHPMVYVIICQMHGFPHQFPITWENSGKSIELGEAGKLVPIFSPKYGYFSSIRFPSYGVLYQMRNAWLFPSIFNSTGNVLQNPPCELSGCFSTVLLFLLAPKSGDSLKEQTEKNR